MKLYGLLLISMLLGPCLQAQVKWKIMRDTVVKWYYMDGDEFNMPYLNTGKWLPHLPWSRGVVSSGCYYRDENVRCDSGLARFTIDRYGKYESLQEWELRDSYLKKHPERLKDNTWLFDYSGGLIWSNRMFKYGHFEIRFKSPAGSGLWPAFWLYGGKPNYEIDFFELKGERNNQMHVDVHCPDGCANYRSNFFDLSKGWGHWIKTDAYFENDFNIVSGTWDKDGIVFYLNEMPVAAYKGHFDLGMNLTAGIGIAQNDGPFHPGENKTTVFPSTMLVDYIRVWSSADTVRDALKNDPSAFGDSQLTVDSVSLYKSAPKKALKASRKQKGLSELGSITLLPIGHSKYSISIAGKDPGPVKIEVYNRAHEKQMGVSLDNMQYYVLNLHGLPTDLYIIEISAMGHTLTHEIPVVDPKTLPQYKKNE